MQPATRLALSPLAVDTSSIPPSQLPGAAMFRRQLGIFLQKPTHNQLSTAYCIFLVISICQKKKTLKLLSRTAAVLGLMCCGSTRNMRSSLSDEICLFTSTASTTCTLKLQVAVSECQQAESVY